MACRINTVGFRCFIPANLTSIDNFPVFGTCCLLRRLDKVMTERLRHAIRIGMSATRTGMQRIPPLLTSRSNRFRYISMSERLRFISAVFYPAACTCIDGSPFLRACCRYGFHHIVMTERCRFVISITVAAFRAGIDCISFFSTG